MATEITNEHIATAALNPEEIQNAAGRVKQRPLADLLAAKKAFAADEALASDETGWGCLRPAQVVPPGSI